MSDDATADADVIVRLRDEADLRALVNRYFYGLDRRDAGALASIYTPDGVPRGDGTTVPVDRHVEGLLRVGRFAFSHHMTGSQAFTIEGDSATGDTYAVAFLAVAPADDDQRGPDVAGRMIVRGLQYLDRYVRTDAGWRIAYRNGPIPLWQYEVGSVPPAIPPFVFGNDAGHV